MTGLLDGLFAGLACAADPFGCAGNWLDARPWWQLVLVGLLVGQLLGAKFGWIGVLATWTAGIGALILRRNSGDDNTAENVDGPDAAPPHRKRKPDKPAQPDTRPGHFNRETGTFNP